MRDPLTDKFSYIIVDRPDSFGSYDAFTDALRRLKDLGYHGVEFNLARPPGFEVDDLVRLSETMALPVVSLLTGANYFGEGLCLSSPRDEVRLAAVERLRECTEVAARFGAIVVLGQMQGFLTDEPDREVGEARIEEGMKRVVETAEKHGTTIAFEPVNHLQAGFHNTLKDVMALAERIDSPHFKPMLDTFHINIEEKSMTEPIHRLGRDIGHFHLCESNGDLLGSGYLDFHEILGALDSTGYAGYVSIKVYRRPWAVGAESAIQFLQEIRKKDRWSQ
jgi:sugar phosphate isomerase/epimerase